jgi:hypothetical protein
MLKLRFPILLIAAATLVAGCDNLNAAPFDGTPGVIMLVVFDSSPTDTMNIALTDPVTIAAARQYVSNGTGPKIVVGPIVRGIGVDPFYPFHFIPDSVRFADSATATCDGAPMHTLADVDSLFQHSAGDVNAASAAWCPSSSRPVGVSQDLIIGNSSR